MEPPFYGTRVLDAIAMDDVEPYLDREALFASRWQFRQGTDPSSWESLKREKVIPLYEGLMTRARAQGIVEPKLVYGYFRCEREGNGLVVHDGSRAYRFDFPRERTSPNRCLSDYFGDGFAIFQIATVGEGAARAAAAEFAGHEYSQAFFIKGLAAEFAEATAKYGHDRIRDELGVSRDRGQRFSPGYPVFPDLSSQKKIAALLRPTRIGVKLTRTFHLVPEHTTSAMISIDENACLFRP